MTRKLIGSLVVLAYPEQTRRERGAEMVDTLLDLSDGSPSAFLAGCVSLLAGGLRERGHRGLVALAGVAALACVGGAAVALTTGQAARISSGQSGRVPTSWIRANMKATTLTGVHDPGCRPSIGAQTRPSGRTQLLDGAPAQALSSTYAVLRHPAPVGVRVSAERVRRLDVDAQGIYIHYARQGVTDGISYYMIPAANVGTVPVPDHCYTAQLTAFEHQVAGLTATQRAHAIDWERQLIQRRKGPDPGVVLVTVGGGSIGAQYLTADRLRADRYPTFGGGGGSNNITKTALIVPDKVASVTATYPAQTYPGRVPAPIQITHRVSENLAVFVFRGAWDPPTLTYHSATGAVITATARLSSAIRQA